MKSARAAHPSRAKLVTAFATVYLFWGSTFLAIRYAIASVPPFFMSGVRFLIAGSALYTFARLRGAPRARREHWWATFVVIAVFLGWLIAGEPVTPRTLLAATVIVSAVALIITDQKESLRQNEVSSLVASGAATEPRPEGSDAPM